MLEMVKKSGESQKNEMRCQLEDEKLKNLVIPMSKSHLAA
jgi:hypothetical protein